MFSEDQINQRKFQGLDRLADNLSPSEQAHLEKLLRNYKLTPMTLALKLNPRLIPAPHLMYISTVVASAISKGGGRIIISLPPRHGKSELITKNVPIWTLENYGRKNMILCSYGAELSTDFGRQIRDIIQENEALLNVRIRPDAERVNNWLTQQGGAMRSVGLGGPITGRGADVLIIDDYIKEIKEALSQVHRDYIWNWFVTTAFTRLEPNGTVIIVATRWHHDDLIGRILKNFPGEFTNIVIPAIAEKQTPEILGRPIGTALFPERYPLGPGPGSLLERKSVLGSFFFNALYQQRPENDQGQLTNRDWIGILATVPELNDFEIVRCWDLAATEEGGDFMVGTLIAYSKSRDMTIILDVKRAQLSPLGVEALVAQTALIDGPGIKIYIEQEPGSSGKLLVANYANTLLKGYKVEAVPANDTKLIRAQPFLAAAEARKVFLIKAAWNEEWLQEYDDFPGGDHDDQVDTAAIGYSKLSGKKLLRASWGRDSLPNANGNHIFKLDMNADNSNDFIKLPNGKIYRVSNGTEVTESDVAASPLGKIIHQGEIIPPKKVGVVWGR